MVLGYAREKNLQTRGMGRAKFLMGSWDGKCGMSKGIALVIAAHVSIKKTNNNKAQPWPKGL
jgi:hypothetical protein